MWAGGTIILFVICFGVANIRLAVDRIISNGTFAEIAYAITSRS